MDAFFLLIPLSVALVGVIAAAFAYFSFSTAIACLAPYSENPAKKFSFPPSFGP